MITPALTVADVARAAAWYQRLGFRLLDRSEQGALLVLGEGLLRLQAGEPSGPRERRDVDLHVLVDDPAPLFRSLDREVEVLEAPTEDEDGLLTFLIRDPDGYWLRFTEGR